MECIYQFDVKGLLSHKKQMVVSVVAALVIIGFFQADIMGYDAYLPEKDETEAVLIEDRYAYDIYSQIIQEREKTGVSGETKDKVLDILAGVVEDNDRNSADYYAEESSSSDYTSCTVTYRLKNGKEHKRVYTLRQEQEEEILGQIFDTQEYREDQYALYTVDRSRIMGIAVDDFEGGEELKMTEEQKTEFLDIFLEELSKLTYETAKTTLPVGRIAVYYSDTDVMAATQSSSVYSYDTYNAVGSRDSYYLYPTFVKTIQYLEEELKLELHISMEDVQITKLSVQEYRDDAISEEYPVSDQEFIDSIKDKLISSVLLEERACYYPLENSILDIIATVETDEGNRELTMYTDADTVKKIEEYLKLK